MSKAFRKTVLSFIPLILLSPLFFYLMKYIAVYQVDGDSMVPLFYTGDYIVAHVRDSYHKGEVIVCANPEDDSILIKEILGTSGDEIILAGGSFYVNGKKTRFKTSKEAEFNHVVLESDSYYIIGENIEVSHDSRSFGPITGDMIIGKVIFKVFPEIGRIPSSRSIK